MTGRRGRKGMRRLRDRRRHLIAEPQPDRHSYSRWDGTQKGIDLDAEHLFDQIADDLLYHGDVHAALRQLMAAGLRDRSGRHLPGINEMLKRLRERRRQLLERNDPNGAFSDVAQSLEEVIATERRALDQLAGQADAAAQQGRDRAAELAAETAARKHAELAMMPPDLSGQIKALEAYDFESDEARQRFDDLVRQLREQLMQQLLDRMAAEVGVSNHEQTDRLKDMLAELNAMLDQRAAGQEPDFDGFMQRYGDLFPENPANLDELLSAIAQRMAAAQALLNSMTPDQRDQLQALSDQLLSDLDLQWHLSELRRNLQAAFPQSGWEQRYNFDGIDPLDFADAVELMAELGDIDRLESLLAGAAHPGALAEADLDSVGELLGADAVESLQNLTEAGRLLAGAGLVETSQRRLKLTPRAVRKIGQRALRDLFSSLSADRLGRHRTHRCGIGHERADGAKPYEYGDPFNLHIERTIRNAVSRAGGGVPVHLHPDDFEVDRTEMHVRSATVLMLDLSLSMPMRDNFLPAKKVAIALHALISKQFRGDYLGLVAFSDVAREFRPEQLPEVSWDYVHGTNMHHALMLARCMLARQSGTKQIIMVTDGQPTAHITPSGQPRFSWPPSPETIALTLSEVSQCTRSGIRINTFALDPDLSLRRFVERITRINGGRAFFTTNQTLGDYLLVDFVEQKRVQLRAWR